jgi:hypothetical protein
MAKDESFSALSQIIAQGELDTESPRSQPAVCSKKNASR